jgi:hypothetical protein
MTARKSGTAQLQNLLNAGGRHASCQQRACDPQIDNAPIRLREALRNVPVSHPALIDLDRLRGVRVCGSSRLFRRWGGRPDIECVAARGGAGGLQETLGLARQTTSGVHDFHPRRIPVRVTALRLLIGETGEPAQVTPVGAGAVTAIEVRQLPAHGSSQSRLQGSRTDMNPSLPMTGAGLEHDARFVPVGAHRPHRCGVGFVQVDQNVAGVAVFSIRVDVHITSLTVPRAQKADGREVGQLCGGPKPFSGKRPPGRIVDQANEVKLTRHGRQLAPDGLHSEYGAEVTHAPNSAIGPECRTMNFQRAVDSVLTGCLSEGAHFSSSFSSQPVSKGCNDAEPRCSRYRRSESPPSAPSSFISRS